MYQQYLYPELSTVLPQHFYPVSSHIQVSTLQLQTPGPRALVFVFSALQKNSSAGVGPSIVDFSLITPHLNFLGTFCSLTSEVVHDLWATDLEISWGQLVRVWLEHESAMDLSFHKTQWCRPGIYIQETNCHVNNSANAFHKVRIRGVCKL